jgi:membrane-bound ClpP family serine protease
MKKRLSSTRLILAVISVIAQLAAIWAVWRWLLPELGVQLAVWGLIIALVAWILVSIFFYINGTRALRTKEYAGLSSMVGLTGKADGSLAPEGMVKIKGELWAARVEQGIVESGESVIIIGEDGLKLLVRRQDQ